MNGFIMTHISNKTLHTIEGKTHQIIGEIFSQTTMSMVVLTLDITHSLHHTKELIQPKGDHMALYHKDMSKILDNRLLASSRNYISLALDGLHVQHIGSDTPNKLIGTMSTLEGIRYLILPHFLEKIVRRLWNASTAYLPNVENSLIKGVTSLGCSLIP